MDDARLRAGVWLRERKERAEEKRQAKLKRLAPGGAPAIWIWFLATIAAATLIGSSWMLVVFIAGSVGHVDWSMDWRNGSDGEPRFGWNAEADLHLIIGVGLFLFCLGIACFNAVWLHVRHYITGLFRTVLTGIGIAVALFMVSGAIVTQQWGTDARERDEVVAVNTAQAGVAAVQAEIASIETEMARLCAPNLTTWQAQACRSGEQAWTDRIDIARGQMRESDPQFQIIARAIADARQGDRWRSRLVTLRQQAATATVTAVHAEAVQVQATGFMAQFAHFLEEIRKPFIAVLGELLAMTMFGVALAAHRSRFHTIEQSGWAREDQRIEDLREEEPVVAQPMKPPRERVTDAETGEELVKVQPHWRKLKKGKKTQVADKPEPEPDERGVEVDGGNRIGTMTVGGPVDVSALAAASDISAKHAPDDQEKGALSEEVKGAAPSDALIQNEPPEMSDEEVAAIAEELEVAPAAAEALQDRDEAARHDVTDDEHHEQNQPIPDDVAHSDLPQTEDEAHEPQSEEPVEQDYTEADQDEPPSEEREPQTDPSRLISVAAE